MTFSERSYMNDSFQSVITSKKKQNKTKKTCVALSLFSPQSVYM